MLAHQIPVILGGRFDPSVIFAEMPGAWLEPRQGLMWQENTGVTPTTRGGQTIGKLVDLSAERIASQSTAANRPLFGVRRNLLTYSEQFDNAAWTKSGSSFIAGKLTEDSSNGVHRLTRDLITTSASHTYVVKAKYAGRAWLVLALADSGGSDRRAWFNVENGNVGTVNTNLTASVSSAGDGWYLCRVTITATYPNAYPYLFLSNADGVWSYQGDGSSGILLGYADLRIASDVGKDPTYQQVTTATDYDAGRFPAIRHADSTDVLAASMPDLGGGVFSSAGSVYFATPQGMSCLHNQSIGTTYNLPALQTDNYCTVITPARLAPPLEQRLALYMHRLAGLEDADFFWQEQATDGMTGQLLADNNDTILLRA